MRYIVGYMNNTQQTKQFNTWVVYVAGIGSAEFHSETIAKDLFNKVEENAAFYGVESNGNMTLIEEKKYENPSHH